MSVYLRGGFISTEVMLMNGNDFSRHAVANTHPHNPVFRLQNFTFETDIWEGYSTLFGLKNEWKKILVYDWWSLIWNFLSIQYRQIHEEHLQPTSEKAEKCIFLSRYNCNIYLELDTNSCHWRQCIWQAKCFWWWELGPSTLRKIKLFPDDLDRL